MTVGAPLLLRCCWLLLLVFGSVAHAKVVAPLKGETDPRDYRHFQLENGLQVLVISDPEAKHAAAAVSVRAGAYQDPAGAPGLAHLVQQSLLTAVEPEAETLSDFVHRHGGTVGAQVTGEYANYQFAIEPDHLEPAVDYLARLLSSPHFSAEAIERGRERVHAVYLDASEEPRRRADDVYRELFAPEHPAANAILGNQDTLPSSETHPLDEAVGDFHSRWYVPGRATLVVSGAASLDELQSLAEGAFGGWSRGDAPDAELASGWFPDDFLPAQVNIRALGNQRQVSLLFPLPSDREHYKRKPLSYIAHSLTREDEGSLVALLRELGWAEALTAGARMETDQETLFEFTVHLTELGVRASNQVVALMFYQIGQLERTILAEWRYLELQQMAALAFRFKSRDSALETVGTLAERLHLYEAEDVLSGDYLYDRYDARLIRQFLRRMRPDNVLVSFVAPELEAEAYSKQYQVPYALTSLEPRQPEIKNRIKKRLYAPQPNPFIPQRVLLKDAPLLPSPGVSSQGDASRPQLILNQPRSRVWFQQDSQFQTPKASLNLRLTLPLVAADQTGAARAELFAALARDRLSSLNYPAAFAGLDFTVEAHARGLDIQVYGYSARQSLLLSNIVEVIQSGRFEQEQFDRVKAELLRQWGAETAQDPHRELARQVPRMHLSPYWTGEDLQEALAGESLENLHRFADAMLQNAQITGLFYGNLYRQEAVRLAAMVEHQLRADPSRRELMPTRTYKIPDQDGPHLYRYPTQHEEHSVLLYVQGLESSIEDAAHMQLLRRVVRPALASSSPDQEMSDQLDLLPMPLRNLEGILFAVRSPTAEGSELIGRIQSFLSAYDEQLEDDLGAHRAALAEELREPAQNLRQQAERYWQSLLLGDLEFNRRANLASAVEQVTAESLLHYFEATVRDPKRQLWIASSDVELPEEFREIRSIGDYRETLQSLTFP
ncbi:insulinase family protein [Marinimicrobium sp. ABcell2]|uniref:insulinase family protein n=1 Tax=Marinimicrobium sp. ABcell2 TaxID=3069751 RepID=UPI0027B7A137|nr:insulinase family protein [Marinimicrobium sp. ABcell2]MDQ2075351.1 insulinase family protein [Marinimicrobium sp. ABcell2]